MGQVVEKKLDWKKVICNDGSIKWISFTLDQTSNKCSVLKCLGVDGKEVAREETSIVGTSLAKVWAGDKVGEIIRRM